MATVKRVKISNDEENEEDINNEDAVSIAGTEIMDLSVTEIILENTSEPVEAVESDTIYPLNCYHIKPILQDKFRVEPIQNIIRSVHEELLSSKIYDPDKIPIWTSDIADTINDRVQELKMSRYKHVVQVVISENKGAGMKTGCRCLWDAETDGYIRHVYINNTIICLSVVFLIYLY